MSDERFLITGAMGCIGSWVARNLVQQDVDTTIFDLATDPHRMRLLMAEEELDKIQFLQGDIAELAEVQLAVAKSQATHVIHLAALQVPFCRANPSLGAQVNVVGTVNVFETVHQAGRQVRGLAYASSVAAFGSNESYPSKPVADDAPLRPNTLYGIYKVANEDTARLYWQDWQVSSVGLRPHIVFGVGRDQGMTSDITKAILAAAADRPYHISFGGPIALQYADDVARIFINAARARNEGATVCNLRNDVISVGQFVDILRNIVPQAQITYNHEAALPFPADLDDQRLKRVLSSVPHTPLESAILQTFTDYRQLLSQGRVDLGQLQKQ